MLVNIDGYTIDTKMIQAISPIEVSGFRIIFLNRKDVYIGASSYIPYLKQASLSEARQKLIEIWNENKSEILEIKI